MLILFQHSPTKIYDKKRSCVEPLQMSLENDVLCANAYVPVTAAYIARWRQVVHIYQS